MKINPMALFLSLLILVLVSAGLAMGAFESTAMALPLYLAIFTCATVLIRVLMAPSGRNQRHK